METKIITAYCTINKFVVNSVLFCCWKLQLIEISSLSLLAPFILYLKKYIKYVCWRLHFTKIIPPTKGFWDYLFIRKELELIDNLVHLINSWLIEVRENAVVDLVWKKPVILTNGIIIMSSFVFIKQIDRKNMNTVVPLYLEGKLLSFIL